MSGFIIPLSLESSTGTIFKAIESALLCDLVAISYPGICY